MITKRTIWEVTARADYGCTCGICQAIYRGHFLGRPDPSKLAEAIRREAEQEQNDALTLLATADAPGSWVGGGPSNAEMADYCMDCGCKLLRLAEKVEHGGAQISFTRFAEAFETEYDLDQRLNAAEEQFAKET